MEASTAPRTVRQVSYDFTGTSVLITGAARGVGASHARAFAAAGADVVASDLRLDGGADNITPLACDVSDAAAVEDLVAATVDAHGKIDVLINNAGHIELYPAHEMDEAVWDRVVDVNLKGTFLCSKAAARRMIEAGTGGKIINTGSGASFRGVPLLSHYVAAKHGVAGLSKTMAVELAPHGITVNYICPTALATPFMAEGFGAEHVPETAGPEMYALVGSPNILDPGAPMAPDEVTNAALWLASDAANYMTGAAFVIDAGFTAK